MYLEPYLEKLCFSSEQNLSEGVRVHGGCCRVSQSFLGEVLRFREVKDATVAAEKELSGKEAQV